MGRNNADFAGGTDRPVYSGTESASGGNWSAHALGERNPSRDIELEPGHKWGREVALLPIDRVMPYQDFDRTGTQAFPDSAKTIKGISEELTAGGVTAMREPLLLGYSHNSHWGYLEEGHHRLEAARRAGLTHVPVRVLAQRSGSVEKRRDLGRGAPLHMDNRLIGHGGYYPATIHPGNFQEFEGAR